MKRLVLVLVVLMLTVGVVEGQSAVDTGILTWTNPTTFVSGKTLVPSQDIKAFQIRYGTTNPPTTLVSIPTTSLPAASTNTYTVNLDRPGVMYYFTVAVTTNTGVGGAPIDSDQTAVVSKMAATDKASGFSCTVR